MGKVRFFLSVFLLLFVCFPLFSFSEQYVYGDMVSFITEEGEIVRKGNIFKDDSSNVFIASAVENGVVVLQRLYGSGKYTPGSNLMKRGALYTLSPFATLDFAGLTLSRTGELYPLIPFLGFSYTYRYSQINVFAGLKTSLSLSSATGSSFFLLKNGYVDILAGIGTSSTFSGVSLLTLFMYRYNLGIFSLSAGAGALKSDLYEFRIAPAVSLGVTV